LGSIQNPITTLHTLTYFSRAGLAKNLPRKNTLAYFFGEEKKKRFFSDDTGMQEKKEEKPSLTKFEHSFV
jgi:hypothetical protein